MNKKCGTSQPSEKYVFSVLNLPPPDLGEDDINIITNTSVPEGIWFNKNIILDKAVRIFGNVNNKGALSVEVKRLYRLTDIPRMATKAVRSCDNKIIDIFGVKHHAVAFVINPELFRKLNIVKKDLIRYVRRAKEESDIICLSLFILLGNDNMMFFK